MVFEEAVVIHGIEAMCASPNGIEAKCVNPRWRPNPEIDCLYYVTNMFLYYVKNETNYTNYIIIQILKLYKLYYVTDERQISIKYWHEESLIENYQKRHQCSVWYIESQQIQQAFPLGKECVTLGHSNFYPHSRNGKPDSKPLLFSIHTFEN